MAMLPAGPTLASRWCIPALLCFLVFGIVGMHVLVLHSHATDPGHAAPVMAALPGHHSGAPHDSVAASADVTHTEEPTPGHVPASQDHAGAMALCLMMLAGAGLGWLLIVRGRPTGSWRAGLRAATHGMVARLAVPPRPSGRQLTVLRM